MKALILAALLAASAAPALAGGSHGAHGGHGHRYTFGEPGKAAEATRTIQVTLTDDMRILHEPFTVKRGETIRFVITNKGQIDHEFAIGDTASQRAHAAMMKKMPDMKHENDPAAITLAGGESGELVWKFSRPIQGQLEFACHLPGHLEAGMVSKVAFTK